MTGEREVDEAKATVGGVALIVGVLLYAASPPWPDDWDGLGFLAAVKHFDLDAFAPHAPGYPVYVALLKLASTVLPDSMDAAKAVLAVSGAMTVVLLSAALAPVVRAPIRARLALALCALATPLGLRCATAVGSEAPALAFTSLALYGLSTQSSRTAGIGVGLALGVRVSWAPLLLPLLLLAPHKRDAVASAVASSLAWVVPFVAFVGPAHLASLSFIHVAGHVTRWGGTAITEPARIRFLLRDLFVDGLGVDADGLGIAVAVALLVSGVLSLAAWKKAKWVGAGSVVLVCVPYLLWVGVGQNLREQPRHVMPLVALMAEGIAVAAWVDRRVRLPCLFLLALVVCRAGLDASDRLRYPPPGAALVAFVRSLPDAGEVLVFGGASARFFQTSELAAHAYSVESMGDVQMTLTRVSHPPSRVLVTSEVTDREGMSTSGPLATLCRPARIDRKRPCLEVYGVDTARLR